MSNIWTSRERMLAALNCQHPDHTPCSFMMYKGLKNQCKDYFEFLEKQMALGLGHDRPTTASPACGG